MHLLLSNLVRNIRVALWVSDDHDHNDDDDSNDNDDGDCDDNYDGEYGYYDDESINVDNEKNDNDGDDDDDSDDDDGDDDDGDDDHRDDDYDIRDDSRPQQLFSAFSDSHLFMI